MELFAIFLIVLFHYVNGNEALHQSHVESAGNSNGHRFASESKIRLTLFEEYLKALTCS